MGTSSMTAPMLTSVCTVSQMVAAPAASWTNRTLLRATTRNPALASRAKIPSTHQLPANPSFSPITAKMKSVWASGSRLHFSWLAPSPTP